MSEFVQNSSADIVDPAMTPTEFVDTILSACDPSNWDCERNKGAHYRGLHDAYTAIHEIAGEYQTAMYEWTRTRAPAQTAVVPVAWQKRPLFGPLRVWTPISGATEDHAFWIEQEYEVRPLYASQPSPAATVETKSAPGFSTSQASKLERKPVSDAALPGAGAQCSADNEDDAGDAATLRGFINTYAMTPSMMASERDIWKRRAQSLPSVCVAMEGRRDAIVQAIHAHVGIRQRINVDLTGVEDAADAILRTLNEPQALPEGVSVDAANKAIEFCAWLSGYIGHGPAVQISSDQMDYIRSKVHPLMVDLGVIRPSSPVSRPLSKCDGADDLEHLDGMLDDRERG